MNNTSDYSFDYLSDLDQFLRNVKKHFQEYKPITENNFMASAAVQNAVLENKDLKQQFLTSSAYLLFLEEILQPTKQLFDESSPLNETFAQIESEKRNYKAQIEQKEDVYQKLYHVNDVIDTCVDINKDCDEIQNIKIEFSKLLEQMQKISKAFDGKCNTLSEFTNLLKEQVAAIQNVNRELSQYVERSQPNSDLVDKLNKLLNSKLMKAFEKQSASHQRPKVHCGATNIEDVSGVKIIASQTDYDILEVFYVNTFFKKSSVEVKIAFHLKSNHGPDSDCTRGAIKHVSIRNSPVNVDDLIEQAIISDNFTSVLPLLQHRLSET